LTVERGMERLRADMAEKEAEHGSDEN
jgi:hypothetical protein